MRPCILSNSPDLQLQNLNILAKVDSPSTEIYIFGTAHNRASKHSRALPRMDSPFLLAIPRPLHIRTSHHAQPSLYLRPIPTSKSVRKDTARALPNPTFTIRRPPKDSRFSLATHRIHGRGCLLLHAPQRTNRLNLRAKPMISSSSSPNFDFSGFPRFSITCQWKT